MSYSFHVRTPERPPYLSVLAALGLPDLVAPEATGAWPKGVTHVYRDRVSTRSTEISHEDDGYEVRILTLACAEDHELALRVAEQLAFQTRAVVRSEDDDEFRPEELRNRFNEEWVAGMMSSQARIIAHWAQEQQKTVTITGPVRPFHIGPRLFAELQGTGASAEMAVRLTETVRSVQYEDLTGYHTAGVMEVSSQDGSQQITLSVWAPDKPVHFPGSQFLHLIPNDRADGLFVIPYDSLPSLAMERFTWLDEKQSLVQSFTSDEWPDLLRRAAPLAVEPFRQRRKWWQFGR